MMVRRYGIVIYIPGKIKYTVITQILHYLLVYRARFKLCFIVAFFYIILIIQVFPCLREKINSNQ